MPAYLYTTQKIRGSIFKKFTKRFNLARLNFTKNRRCLTLCLNKVCRLGTVPCLAFTQPFVEHDLNVRDLRIGMTSAL